MRAYSGRALAVIVLLASAFTAVVAPAVPAGAVTGAGGFVGVGPARLLDTRVAGQGPCVSGTRNLVVGGVGSVPATAAGVVLNVTVVGAASAGYLTVFPTGVSRPGSSSLNYVTGATVPNAVTVKLGSGGAVSLYTNSGCPHVIVDVAGYYAAGVAGAGGFVGLTPTRLVDTRTAGPCVGSARDVVVAGVAGVPASAVGVVLNVTATGATRAGYLTVFPTGVPQPGSSNLNFGVGQTIANAVTVKVGTAGKVRAAANAGCPNVIVDVVGYFVGGAPVVTGGFVGVTPFRLSDTRIAAQGPCVAGLTSSAGTRDLTIRGMGSVPDGVGAVSLNVTVTGAVGSGYVTVFTSGAAEPTSSNLNFTAGQTVANSVTVRIGKNGSLAYATNAGCPNVVVDVVGYYTLNGSVPTADYVCPSEIHRDGLGYLASADSHNEWVAFGLGVGTEPDAYLYGETSYIAKWTTNGLSNVQRVGPVDGSVEPLVRGDGETAVYQSTNDDLLHRWSRSTGSDVVIPDPMPSVSGSVVERIPIAETASGLVANVDEVSPTYSVTSKAFVGSAQITIAGEPEVTIDAISPNDRYLLLYTAHSGGSVFSLPSPIALRRYDRTTGTSAVIYQAPSGSTEDLQGFGVSDDGSRVSFSLNGTTKLWTSGTTSLQGGRRFIQFGSNGLALAVYLPAGGGGNASIVNLIDGSSTGLSDTYRFDAAASPDLSVALSASIYRSDVVTCPSPPSGGA